MSTMTIEKYKKLKEVDIRNWTHEECAEADRLIRKETLIKANKVIDKFQTPEIVKEYIKLMVSCHFGSGETDELLMSLDCYPEWI